MATVDTIRIMTVNTSCKQGGAAQVASGLHDHFNQGGSVSSILVAVDAEAGVHSRALHISKFRHWANVCAYRLLGDEGKFNKSRWDMILGECLAHVDLVHLHNAHGYYLPPEALRRLLRRRILWTLHDFWLLTGGCAFPLDCSEFEAHCRSCRLLGRYPSQWLTRRKDILEKKRELLDSEDVWFSVPSHSFKESAVRMGLPENRVFVVENPVGEMPDDLFLQERPALRAELGLPGSMKIALFVANRIEQPRKGLSTFLSALSDEKIRKHWCGLVVGHKNSSGRAPWSFSSNIIYRPFTRDRNLLYKYFRAADVFTNPSVSETFGLVNVEALSAGCPVLCSDLPVFREHGCEHMRHFPIGAHRHLVRLLADFPFEYLAEEEKMSLAKSVARKYSMKAISEKYRLLYDQILLP